MVIKKLIKKSDNIEFYPTIEVEIFGYLYSLVIYRRIGIEKMCTTVEDIKMLPVEEFEREFTYGFEEVEI